MTDEQRRRIDDHRPAVGLQWDENNPPPRVPFERPEKWTILLTSGNHGLVGAYGHTFPHAEGDHERINVVDEAVATKLRGRVAELEAAGNTNKAVLTDEQIDIIAAKWTKEDGDYVFDREDFHKCIYDIEAAVLSNASKAVVAEQGKLGEPVPDHILEAIREYGDLRADDKASSTVQMANIILAMRRHYRAAPAPADNPSTADDVRDLNLATAVDTAIYARRGLSEIEAYLENNDAPADVRNHSINVRNAILELSRLIGKLGLAVNPATPKTLVGIETYNASIKYLGAMEKVEGRRGNWLRRVEVERLLAAPALNPSDVPSPWISVDERLPSGRYCLATYRNRAGKLRIIRAMYVRQYEVEATGDECDSEYNEADDRDYLKAGWLECIDNWGEYSSVYVVEGPVTHWMPLPAVPDAIVGAAAQSVEGGEA